MKWTYSNPYDKLYRGGVYRNRFAIEDDTPIIGGVSYGEHPGEAIVVNPDGAPRIYEQWYGGSIARASVRGVVQRNKVLRAVYDTVDEGMLYDAEAVDEIVRGRRGKKIDLNVFMQQRVGVCRHMALAAGTLLQFHKDDGHIRGTPRVNRSVRTNASGVGQGHAWTHYVPYSGSTMILDVAQHYLGPLDNSSARNNPDAWDYSATLDR